jgi:hypothetical protein
VLPCPDVRGIPLIFFMMMSAPLMLGAIGILLASSTGAQDVVRLPAGRHLLATAFGTLLGCLTLAGIVSVWLFVKESVEATILLLLVAALAPGVIGYQSAKQLSLTLNVYTCRSCGVRFRSRFASRQCEGCAEAMERAMAEWPMRNVSTDIRRL